MSTETHATNRNEAKEVQTFISSEAVRRMAMGP